MGLLSGRVAVSGATILLDLAFSKIFDGSSFDRDFFAADDNQPNSVSLFVPLLLGVLVCSTSSGFDVPLTAALQRIWQ